MVAKLGATRPKTARLSEGEPMPWLTWVTVKKLLGLRVQGLGFRADGSGFRLWGLDTRIAQSRHGKIRLVPARSTETALAG